MPSRSIPPRFLATPQNPPYASKDDEQEALQRLSFELATMPDLVVEHYTAKATIDESVYTGMVKSGV